MTAANPARSARTSARGAIPPFLAIDVMTEAGRRAAAGQTVFDLSIGQPSTSAPEPVLDAARAAMGADPLGYTPALGIMALRERIASYYFDSYRLSIEPADVLLTTGSSGAFLLAFLAAFDPGDVVALPRPGYPAYRNLLRALGCEVLDVPAGPESEFRITVEALEALPTRPAGLVLASPANPTGSMLSPAGLRDVAAWCDANDVVLISDEIYHGLVYGDAEAACARTFSESAWVVNSFSKYFSMTGWRLGWMIAPTDAHETLDRLAGNVALCPPAISQYAALAAFDAPDELAANIARYRANRDLLARRLPELGVSSIAPMDGAFYAYADVSAWTRDTPEFCARLLAETGVAVTPGVDFDPVDGARFIRLCYAGDHATIGAALDALAEWLPTLLPV